MQKSIALLAFIMAMFFVYGTPVTADDSHTYAIMHISDIQSLSERYPSTLNYTFSYLESIKNTYNISAIIITGDIVESGDNATQWTNYINARSLTTIPVYEIPGNHDLEGEDNNSLFTKFLGKNTNWNAIINDFIFIGIGYSDYPLSDSDISSDISYIEGNPEKFVLIAAHNYFNHDLTLSQIGESIKNNLVLKPTFVMSGHAHSNTLRSSLVNNYTYVEDLTDYQDNGDFSAGKLYTLSVTDRNVSKITVRNTYILPMQYFDPEKIVYDTRGTTNLSSWQVPNEHTPEISPITTTIHFADEIEDKIEDKLIPDPCEDNKSEQFAQVPSTITPITAIIHFADEIEDNVIPDI